MHMKLYGIYVRITRIIVLDMSAVESHTDVSLPAAQNYVRVAKTQSRT